MSQQTPGKRTVVLQVNGDRHEIAIHPWRTLSEVLREDLGLVGTKVGCGHGDCGACTVMIDGSSVCSCLYLAMEAEGREVQTIEGLATLAESLHPVQQAFIGEGALQCGFCTPGMVMSTVDLLAREPTPDEAVIRAGLSGNLCRCTGYNRIVAAVQTASGQAGGARSESADGTQGPA